MSPLNTLSFLTCSVALKAIEFCPFLLQLQQLYLHLIQQAALDKNV